MSEQSKRFETLRARAALSGVVLHTIENDIGQRAYIVTKWALTRELESLDAVAVWLDAVAGTQPAVAGNGGDE